MSPRTLVMTVVVAVLGPGCRSATDAIAASQPAHGIVSPNSIVILQAGVAAIQSVTVTDGDNRWPVVSADGSRRIALSKDGLTAVVTSDNGFITLIQ